MPIDPRIRYEVLQPLALPGGRSLWVRVGYALSHQDGTIDATFEALVSGQGFRLCPLSSSEDGSEPPIPRLPREMLS